MPLDVTKVYATLNAPAGASQLHHWATDWITETGVRELARLSRMYVHEDVLPAVDAATLATLAVIGDGVALRSATVRELDAEDPSRSVSGAAQRYVAGETAYTYWPSTPTAVSALQARVMGATTNVPGVLFVLARWGVIREARAAETDGRMPEVAAYIHSIQTAIEAALKEKWS